MSVLFMQFIMLDSKIYKIHKVCILGWIALGTFEKREILKRLVCIIFFYILYVCAFSLKLHEIKIFF